MKPQDEVPHMNNVIIFPKLPLYTNWQRLDSNWRQLGAVVSKVLVEEARPAMQARQRALEENNEPVNLAA